VGEGKSTGSGPLRNLNELDLHLSIVALEERITEASASPTQGFDIYSSDRIDSPNWKGTPRTESEIIVRIDSTDYNMDSSASAPVTRSESE
jgi:hypothetical protein